MSVDWPFAECLNLRGTGNVLSNELRGNAGNNAPRVHILGHHGIGCDDGTHADFDCRRQIGSGVSAYLENNATDGARPQHAKVSHPSWCTSPMTKRQPKRKGHHFRAALLENRACLRA